MRTALLLAAKLIVGALLLALIFQRVPLAEALAAATRAGPRALALAAVLFFAAHAVNALKLRVFLPDLSTWQALRFTFIALFYGAALPGQLAGDAVKAVRLMRIAAGGNAGRAAAAVALDKVVGLFALMVLTALGLGLEAQVMGAAMARAASAAAILAAGVLAALVVMPAPSWLGRWGRAFQAWRDSAVPAPALLTALALGLLFSALSIAVLVVLGQALGIQIPAAAWAVVVGLTSLALLLPVTIAGLGLREASLVGLLGVFGQAAPQALALSFAWFALTLLGALAGAVAEAIGRDQP